MGVCDYTDLQARGDTGVAIGYNDPMHVIDTVLTNARIATMDPALPDATALAYGGGVLAAVGTDAVIRSLAPPDARVLDLQGKTVLPGFFDAHCHLRGLGIVLRLIDTSPSRAPDLLSLIALLRADTPAGDGWIVARGYDQNQMAEWRAPTAQELDQVSTERPIALIHASGHGLVVNSLALRLAGITSETPDPAGGTIERGPGGQPTGVLTENAMSLVRDLWPTPTQADLVAAITRASAHLAAMGITSSVEASATLEDLDALRAADAQNLLTVRCHPWVLADVLRAHGFPSPQALWTGGSDRVCVQTAKIFSDGALGMRTAFLRAPFADSPANYGTPIWTEDELLELAAGAQGAGWQLAIHAIGDAAIDLCLNAYEQLNTALHRADPNASPLRHRIEHAMLLHDDQLACMGALGVIPVFQPEFIRRFGDGYVTALGEERASSLMPYQSVLAAQTLPLVFSSDLPVVPGNPLDGIRAAVERKTPSGHVLGKGQAVSVLDALRAYTSGAAFACRSEHETGTLAPGLRADLVVLSHDPQETPLDEWDRIKVEATVIDGDVVHGDWEAVTAA